MIVSLWQDICIRALQLTRGGVHFGVPLVVTGIVAEVQRGGPNGDVMISQPQESSDSKNIAFHLLAAEGNILDRSDILVGVIVDVCADDLRTQSSFAGMLVNVPPD